MVEDQGRLGILEALAAVEALVDHPPKPFVMPNEPADHRTPDLGGFEERFGRGIDRQGVEGGRQNDDGIVEAIENFVPEVQLNRAAGASIGETSTKRSPI